MQDLTVEQFVSQYEAPRVPVVITGLTDNWPAQQQWTPKRLLEQYREHRFKVGANTQHNQHNSRQPQPTGQPQLQIPLGNSWT